MASERIETLFIWLTMLGSAFCGGSIGYGLGKIADLEERNKTVYEQYDYFVKERRVKWNEEKSQERLKKYNEKRANFANRTENVYAVACGGVFGLFGLALGLGRFSDRSGAIYNSSYAEKHTGYSSISGNGQSSCGSRLADGSPRP